MNRKQQAHFKIGSSFNKIGEHRVHGRKITDIPHKEEDYHLYLEINLKDNQTVASGTLMAPGTSTITGKPQSPGTIVNPPVPIP